MSLKPIALAAALLAASSLASALTVQNLGPATLTYDESSPFAFLNSWGSSSATDFDFQWTVPNSVQVSGFGPTVTASFTLPTFTLTANPGYTLSGVFTGLLGNLAYTEIGGATTGILAYADVSINGGPATSVSAGVGWTSTFSAPGVNLGYFGDSASTPSLGNYNSITISNASIVLSASGGTFSSIISNPQNKLRFEYEAAPVPEPQTYAMLLAGLGIVGWMARRRQR